MRMSSKAGFVVVASALLALASGCGGGDDAHPRLDAGFGNDAPPDLPSAPPDGPKTDTILAADTTPTGVEVAAPSDGPADAPVVDTIAPALDTSAVVDAPAAEGGVLDAGRKLDGSPIDSVTGVADGAAPASDAPADVPADGYEPGPATALVVNSGNTATYNLTDGTWKVFYFDATAGQLYCISSLSGITRGYVSTSPSVSPSNYQYATSPEGTLAFRAANTQRHYVAVAVTGGGTSGSFQVADGGQLLALGANSVTLPAPDLDNYYFFRFPITAGHAYSLSVAGTSTTSVGLGLSATAERASNGQFSSPLRGVSGPLPFSNEGIPDTSVAQSYSGFYFLFLHVYSLTSVTITITQTS